MNELRTAVILAAGVISCSRAMPEPVSSKEKDDATAIRERDERAAPAAKVHVAFTPEDLLSTVRSTPLTLWAEDESGKDVGADTLEDLASNVSLRTYPELTAVQATVHIEPAPPPVAMPEAGSKGQLAQGGSSRSRRAAIEIVPASSLQGRWYVLSLATLPKGVVPWSSAGVPGSALGAYASRFNPDSSPVRRSVQLCKKEKGVRLVVNFSEGLELSADTANLVRAQHANARACSVVQGALTSGQESIFFDCESSVWTDQLVHLDTGAGLRSAAPGKTAAGVLNGSAKTIRDMFDSFPRSEDMDFNSQQEVDGCKVIR